MKEEFTYFDVHGKRSPIEVKQHYAEIASYVVAAFSLILGFLVMNWELINVAFIAFFFGLMWRYVNNITQEQRVLLVTSIIVALLNLTALPYYNTPAWFEILGFRNVFSHISVTFILFFICGLSKGKYRFVVAVFTSIGYEFLELFLSSTGIEHLEWSLIDQYVDFLTNAIGIGLYFLARWLSIKTIDVPSNQRRLFKFVRVMVIISVIQLILFTFVAIHFFRGGNKWYPGATHFDFWLNVLSDLGQLRNSHGETNHVSMVLFDGSLVFFSSCTLAYWLFLRNKTTQRIRALGVISSIGSMIIALIPNDLLFWLHGIGVAAWLFPLLLILVFRSKQINTCKDKVFGFSFMVLLIAYLIILVTNTIMAGNLPIPLSPIFQKLVTGFILIWYLVHSKDSVVSN